MGDYIFHHNLLTLKKRFINIKPETVFLILGLIYGLGFLVITPPFQVIDEGEHFDKALFLSEGHITPELKDYPGYYVPESANKLKLKFYVLFIGNHEKLKFENIIPLFYQPLNKNNLFFTGAVSTTAIITYSPIPYLAPTFAIFIGKLLNISPLLLMYIGRLSNLLVWLFIIYIAIKLTPVHKWVMLMLSLMPMTIFQGSSLSADSFTIAISFLTIAIFFKFSIDKTKKTINTKDIIVLFILMLTLALTKQTYFFLSFLFFLIPIKKFGSLKKKLLLFALLFLITFEICILWSMAFRGFYTPLTTVATIPNQTAFLLSNPFNFPYVFINSFLSTDTISNIIISFVGNLGWDILYLPTWLVGMYFSMLILTSLLDKKYYISITNKQKIVISITLIVIFVLICILMYITGTLVAQNTISNIDGRYLIPIAPLLFLLFYNQKIKFDIEKGFNLIIICFIIFSLTITIYLTIKNFYIV